MHGEVKRGSRGTKAIVVDHLQSEKDAFLMSRNASKSLDATAASLQKNV